ncbi:MAG: hypothetical protein M3480_00400, partial [Verrucomicrobiota bacterium]|nr:hypothetical protein [Verrucomicrobiota bacterium]
MAKNCQNNENWRAAADLGFPKSPSGTPPRCELKKTSLFVSKGDHFTRKTGVSKENFVWATDKQNARRLHKKPASASERYR